MKDDEAHIRLPRIPALKGETAAGVPRRSKVKSGTPGENGVDGLMKGQIRNDPVQGLQQRETEEDQWSRFSQTIKTIVAKPITDTLQKMQCTTKLSGHSCMRRQAQWTSTVYSSHTLVLSDMVRKTQAD